MGDTILEKYEERKAELRTVSEILSELRGLLCPLGLVGPQQNPNLIFYKLKKVWVDACENVFDTLVVWHSIFTKLAILIFANFLVK